MQQTPYITGWLIYRPRPIHRSATWYQTQQRVTAAGECPTETRDTMSLLFRISLKWEHLCAVRCITEYSYAVNAASCYNTIPTYAACKAVLHILRYVSDTRDQGV